MVINALNSGAKTFMTDFEGKSCALHGWTGGETCAGKCGSRREEQKR
jgi:hypothetical protein